MVEQMDELRRKVKSKQIYMLCLMNVQYFNVILFAEMILKWIDLQYLDSLIYEE